MIRDQLADALRAALATLEVEPLPDVIQLERPARREHGDWSSNVALATAKKAGRNPRELAGQLAEMLDGVAAAPRRGGRDRRSRVRQLPPGRHAGCTTCWPRSSSQGVDGYARLDVGAGTKVMVEFVSANPTGPAARRSRPRRRLRRLAGPGARARAATTSSRENYLNDRGTQMQLFAASLAARQAGEPVPEGGYQGEYIVEWAAEIPDGRRRRRVG